MSNDSSPKSKRKLNPLPRGLIELYGLIAVVVVLIPEWIAEITLTLSRNTSDEKLPLKALTWQTQPELRLASMNLKELRQLAKELGILGYSSENRDELTKRLMRSLKKRALLNKPSKR